MKFRSQQRGGRAWIAIVVAAGLLSVGLFFLGRYSAPKQSAQSGALAKSIAILPFENRSEDKSNGYFADGIQDEILTRLAKIDDLKVISRTSTLRYKSSPENLPEIAKELGVAHILEGSVQKSGEKVRVNVQLINAGTDSHLWAEVYDRKLTDIFVVESEVAEKIADSLRAKLAGSERKELKASPTENAEAYDAYLRGIAIWGKLSTSAESSETTATYYKRAVQLDPKFAVARQRWPLCRRTPTRPPIERRSSWRKQRPRSTAPLNCNLIWATPGLRSAPIVIAA